jgi:hypothetical protein
MAWCGGAYPRHTCAYDLHIIYARSLQLFYSKRQKSYFLVFRRFCYFENTTLLCFDLQLFCFGSTRRPLLQFLYCWLRHGLGGEGRFQWGVSRKPLSLRVKYAAVRASYFLRKKYASTWERSYTLPYTPKCSGTGVVVFRRRLRSWPRAAPWPPRPQAPTWQGSPYRNSNVAKIRPSTKILPRRNTAAATTSVWSVAAERIRPSDVRLRTRCGAQRSLPSVTACLLIQPAAAAATIRLPGPRAHLGELPQMRP